VNLFQAFSQTKYQSCLWFPGIWDAFCLDLFQIVFYRIPVLFHPFEGFAAKGARLRHIFHLEDYTAVMGEIQHLTVIGCKKK
jgi:hypothetical protein